MATTSKEKTKDQAPPKEATSRGAVAVIEPARLGYPLEARQYGVDEDAWKALTDAIFPSAVTSGGVLLALAYCRKRNLDPFKRPVHVVPIYDKKKRRMIDTIWPGIAELRTTAMRTGLYAGCDPTRFGPDMTETFSGTVTWTGQDGNEQSKNIKVQVTYPAYAEITVYRLVDGVRHAFPGPRCYWKASYGQQGRVEVPNERWTRSPSYMLEKVAEAAALRKAFPEEIGNQLSAEEVEDRMTIDSETGEIIEEQVPRQPPPKRPARVIDNPADAGHENLDDRYRDTLKEPDPSDPGEPVKPKPEPEATKPAAEKTAPAEVAPDPAEEQYRELIAAVDQSLANFSDDKAIKTFYFTDAKCRELAHALPARAAVLYDQHWSRIKRAKAGQ